MKYRLLKKIGLIFVFLLIVSSQVSADNNAENVYVYIITDLTQKPSGFDLQLYRGIRTLKRVVAGFADIDSELVSDKHILYVISKGLTISSRKANAANLIELRNAFHAAEYHDTNISVVNTTPSPEQIVELLDYFYKRALAVGYIYDENNMSVKSLLSQSHREYSFVASRRDANTKAMKSVNELINYNRVDVLMLSDDKTIDRPTRRKIIISSFQQHREVIGMQKDDVDDGALASIGYSDEAIVRATVTMVNHFVMNKKHLGENIYPDKISLRVNERLAEARDITINKEYLRNKYFFVE